MKRIFLISIVTALSAFANAKSGAECKAELFTTATSAGYSATGRYLIEQSGGLPELKDCKNVEYTTQQGQRIDNKVYLTADQSALIVEDQLQRKLSFSLIPGGVSDYAVMAGRLIISTQDKRVLVVGRNGNIFEMLTSSGKSYKDVKGIAIKNGVLHMEQFNNQPIVLDEAQVTRRINEPGKFRAIAF